MFRKLLTGYIAIRYPVKSLISWRANPEKSFLLLTLIHFSQKSSLIWFAGCGPHLSFLTFLWCIMSCCEMPTVFICLGSAQTSQKRMGVNSYITNFVMRLQSAICPMLPVNCMLLTVTDGTIPILELESAFLQAWWNRNQNLIDYLLELKT